ncbi:Serine/threonine-protein kinase PrkC [Rubripirellula obstinata]|uniref:non-specific serine/threonine protein kinase n=1 Tax=Rubripirellula obstinata TaxID=406547 RepID=A0A5B1CJI4_9BACT|nr:serine/threonine-protein kinase [Rubripirellula obstinata]KAA1260442.1 Serine/threonine-protein kinase PrkC [Rubripirellula obstinata]
MSKTDHRPEMQTPQRPLQRIDRVCDAFETQCLNGEKPSIDDFIREVPPQEQSQLFYELLRLDFEYACKRGNTPDREFYLARYPDHQDAIDKVFFNSGELSRIQDQRRSSGTSSTEIEETLNFSASGDTFHLTEPVQSQTASIEGYEIIDEIARGGMGIVYKARQIDANRVVALKMILSGTLAGESEVARFKIEAESAASLNHPGIVPIYDVGESQGMHYFSMGFIDGPSLKGYQKNHSPGPKRAAEIVKAVADAISHAHSKGIIHRDLKPANILIDEDGNPRVTDFGLSKILEGQTDLTGTGQLLGTPAYMSPEQAAGQTSKVGPLSDVYSLGAMLYELVSGRTPFESESIIGMLEQVCSKNPDSLRSLSPTADTDIESICMKCLEKEPAHRYQSAAALADDLGRYLDGSPIIARRTPRTQKLIRWCRRKPLIAGLAACSLVTFLIFGSTTAYFAVSSSANNSIAIVEREKNDTNFAIAQNAVDQMVDQARLLEDIPRTETQRKEFLVNATDFYEGFLEQRPDDPELQHQAAVLHRSMGDIFRLLGEVDPAHQAYDQSIKLLRQLVMSQPDDVRHKEQLRESHLWLSVLLKPVEVESAIGAIDRAFNIQNALSKSAPGQTNNQYGLARVLYNRGLLLSERGDVESAEKDYQRAERGFKNVLLDLDAAKQRECRLYLSHTLNNFGMLLKMTQRCEEAKVKVQNAIELLADISESRKERRELAIYFNNLSNIYASTGEVDEAITINQESIDLLERLVQDYPRYPDLKNSLANALNSHGSLAGRGGQLPKAAEFFGKAEVVFQQLLDDYPGNVIYSNRLGNSKYNHAVVSYMQATHDAAITQLNEALTLHRYAFDSNPNNVEFAGNLRNDYSLLVKSQLAIGQLSEMQRTIDQCLDTFPDDAAIRVQAAKWLASGIKMLRGQDDKNSSASNRLVEKFGQQAVSLLDSAREQEHMPSIFDGDEVAVAFEPLADRSDFQQLIAELRSESQP